MKLLMASPDQMREINIEWLECMSTTGGYVILPGHAPFVALLMPQQPLSMKLPHGAVKTFTVTGGVMSVARDEIVLVLEEGV